MIRKSAFGAIVNMTAILLLIASIACCDPKPLPAANAAAKALEDLGAKLKRDDNGRVIEVSLASKKFQADDLRYLASFPRLRTLSLYETPLTDDGLAHLKSLTSLKNLNLGSCRKVTDAGLKYLEKLENLESLNLGFCRKITDEGFAILTRFPELKSLNLSITNVTDDRLKTVAGLKNLRHLDLDNAPITDAGIEHLKSLRNLRSLRFVGAAVGDDGLETLHEVKSLRFLNVTDSLVTDAGIAAFKKALPKCTVTGGSSRF